ncbi:MAG: L,D-transpeptidase/peptidoglycan binding protein [Actinomycetota bacterium]|nr:L,D-transpeptidase/peptidoglycan binding protein [Actinomycetota bacterium]
METFGVTARYVSRVGNRKLSRVVLIVGSIVLLLMIVGIFFFLLVQDVFAFGTFPQGTSIEGVSVAGLSRTEATSYLRRELKTISQKPLSLEVDDEKYQIKPEEIGLRLEYEKMIEEAYKEAWNVNIFERMGRRFLNRPKKINISLMAVGDSQKVKEFVERALGSINRPPHDAYVDVTSGTPVIVKAKDGRETDLNELLPDTMKALKTPERKVEVKVKRTPAPIQDSLYSRFILVNLRDHTLTLYEREKPIAQFPVACGSPSYPTTVGHWKIVTKEKNPSWRNPGTAWAKSMPPSIPPGPGNPLGTRAMALNAKGEVIHGTPSPWSVGRSLSHGCVRMYIKDVEQLFEMVELNTHVFIIKEPGNPGWDVTQTPLWLKKDLGLVSK